MSTTCNCPNIGNCDKADNKDPINVPEGADLVCPDCGAQLVAAQRPPKRVPLIWISVAAAILVIALGFVFWPKRNTNGDTNRESVESSLKEVWPWLKATQ